MEGSGIATGLPVLMALDIGNTNVSVGLFVEDQLAYQWRLASNRHRCPDEYGLDIVALVQQSRVALERVTACAIASVVPPLTQVMVDMSRRYFNHPCLLVTPELKALPANHYEDPRALGADRLANVTAAWSQYAPLAIARGAGAIAVVDLGTATKVEAITLQGEYLGGVIAPGVGISAQALYKHAARLPRVEMAPPSCVLGRNNVIAIQSGLCFGLIGQVEGLLKRIAAELGTCLFAVATGGYARLVADACPSIDVTDLALTLKGIHLLWQWNQGGLESPAF